MSNQTTSHAPLALRPREAAKSLGISERTLWSLTHPRGPIRCVRLGKGGVVLYPIEALQAWLLQASGAEPAEPADAGN